MLAIGSEDRFSVLAPKLDAVFSSLLANFDPSELDLSDILPSPQSLQFLTSSAFYEAMQLISSISSIFTINSEIRVRSVQLLYSSYHVPIGEKPSNLDPLIAYLLDPNTGKTSGDGGVVGMAKPKGIGVITETRSLRRKKAEAGLDASDRESLRRPSKRNGPVSKFTGFVVGPEQDNLAIDSDGWAGAKAIYLEPQKPSTSVSMAAHMEQHRLLVFQFEEFTTLIIILDGSKNPSLPPSAFLSLTPELVYRLPNLSRNLAIAESAIFNSVRDRDTQRPLFYFHNSRTRVSETNIPPNGVPSDVLEQMEDAYMLLSASTEVKEAFIKLDSDTWVIASKTGVASGSETRRGTALFPSAGSGPGVVAVGTVSSFGSSNSLGPTGNIRSSAVVSGSAVQVGTGSGNKGLHSISGKFVVQQKR
ncbi:hypothetical protein HDU84_003712 [Entophlyctis sp. JEL0112]|nr:hypothetical protein HDU84_003712 [Entophlyctis sp. JEL0112]